MILKSMVMDYCHEFNFKRSLLLNSKELCANNSTERITCRRLLAETQEYHNNHALDLLENILNSSQ